MYQQIIAPEMRELLEPLGFKQMQLPNTQEIVYGKPFSIVMGDCTMQCTLRVYTSIAANLGVSRDRGADAIRLVVVYRAPGRQHIIPVHHELPNTARTDGWAKRLIQKIDMLLMLRHTPACPSCGSYMRVVSPNKGKQFVPFLSCIFFPLCRGVLKLEKD